jgi:Tol biopolymer transport system component
MQVVNPDGSNLHTVGTAPFAGNPDSPQWSPDGSKIAFQGGGQIWVVNADGTNAVQLTSGSGYSNRAPAWSPDGTKIAFHRLDLNPAYYPNYTTHIWVMDADGGNLTEITTGTAATYPFDYEPTWSPDGTKIAFERRYRDPATQIISSDIYVVPASGGAVTALTNTLGSTEYEREPDWSVDDKIVFACNADQSENLSDLCVMNGDGTGQTVIIDTPSADEAHDPSWSPDGTKLVYHLSGGGNGLFVANADGSSPTQIPVSSLGNRPDWGPGEGSPPAACADGIDNDDDGKIDHPADPGCAGPGDGSETDQAPPPPGGTPQCRDGVDNDGDGKIDGQDPGCSGSRDNDERNLPQCRDRIDNDRDGKTDFPADPSCESPNENSEGGANETPPKGLTEALCTLRGRSQGVRVRYQGGQTQIFGTPGDDVILGTSLPDLIQGFGGNDLICGFAGSDHIRGGEGDDIISGGDDIDGVLGEEGNDRLFGDDGDDELWGKGVAFDPNETDVCVGGFGNDTLNGCDTAVP